MHADLRLLAAGFAAIGLAAATGCIADSTTGSAWRRGGAGMPPRSVDRAFLEKATADPFPSAQQQGLAEGS
jgi:hypothetical protein